MNEAAKNLREKWLKPGDVVYTSLNHVSRSGMQRVIRVFVIRDNATLDISYEVSEALGWKLSNKHEGVVVKGMGMDMGFYLVYSLSQCIFANEKEIAKTDNMSPVVNERDRGYWLGQRWL